MEELHKEICEQVNKGLKNIKEQGIQQSNVDYLGKLIDIQKDIKNIEYWEEKIKMMYRGNYGNYGAFDNYRDSGNYGYGARGYDTRYRGYDSLDRINNEYGRYMENQERYGLNEDTNKSYHYMVEAWKDFTKVLNDEAKTPEQKQMLKNALQQIMM